MTDDYFVTAIYDPSVKYKLTEEYRPDSFSIMDIGKLYAKWGFNSADDALPWFLSLGDKVKVIEPPEMLEKMKGTLPSISEKYLQHDIQVSCLTWYLRKKRRENEQIQ